MVFRKVVESIDKRHRIPSDRTRPEIRRQSRLRISPALLFRFIPAVIEQTGFRIARARLHPNELLRDIVEGCVLVKGRGVLGVERLAHVQAIEPHLVRINLLVPKATLMRARLRLQLFAQQIGSLLVFLLFSYPIERQQKFSFVDIIEVVVVQLVGFDRALSFTNRSMLRWMKVKYFPSALFSQTFSIPLSST